MKIFDDKMAPNPRRVRIFLAEKGIAVPYEQVAIMKGEHKTPAHRARNALEQLPVLELDDGSHIAESVAICRYFEELQPDPPLLGRTPKEKATIEMWQRQVEFNLYMPVAQTFRHTHPAMGALETQIKEWGELNRERATKAVHWLDAGLAGKDFITGPHFSIADITAMCAIDFGRIWRFAIPDSCANVKRWHQSVAARPSAQA
ncbi:MAG: glutathione S-transferase [Alphaproteobacteria bacterium]|nr:glutathione S-transferase [Alphaproteobacteria bacterium]